MWFLKHSDLHNVWGRDIFFLFSTLYSGLKNKNSHVIKCRMQTTSRYYLFTFCINFRSIYASISEDNHVSDTVMIHILKYSCS